MAATRSAASATAEPSRTLTVFEAVSAVMDEVQAVSKDSRNSAQNFNFRGIDAVMNVVGPALRRHSVIVVPYDVRTVEHEATVTKNGAAMTMVRIVVTYRWFGPAGDYFDTQVPAESFDYGDKGTPKAMSVAFRTLLLQALCIPTDEPDPDSQTFERGAPPAKQGTDSVPAEFEPAVVQEVIDRLQEASKIEVGADRLISVHAILETADPRLLKQVVTVKGRQATVQQVADAVATGALAG